MSDGNATAKRTRWTLGRVEKFLAIVVSALAILTFIFTFVISSPTLQTPVEDKFIATPMSFGNDLTVSVKKGRTTDKGIITVFACSPDGHHHLMGDTAYGTAPDDFVMGGRYEADVVTLIINVAAEDGDPKTVISKWNLDSLSRTKPPVSRDGRLGCLDIRED
jgi:hypothetical protein